MSSPNSLSPLCWKSRSTRRDGLSSGSNGRRHTLRLSQIARPCPCRSRCHFLRRRPRPRPRTIPRAFLFRIALRLLLHSLCPLLQFLQNSWKRCRNWRSVNARSVFRLLWGSTWALRKSTASRAVFLWQRVLAQLSHQLRLHRQLRHHMALHAALRVHLGSPSSHRFHGRGQLLRGQLHPCLGSARRLLPRLRQFGLRRLSSSPLGS